MNSSTAGLPPGDCIDQASAWCLRLAEGKLSPADRESFEVWLAADSQHPPAFNRVAGSWQAVGDVSLTPELIVMRRASLDNYRRAQGARWKSTTPSRRMPWLAAAASFVIAVIGAATWLTLAPTRYETGLAERRVVMLQDGSKLTLDAQSRVDVRYSRGRRELWLHQGRAKFDVARNVRRPFTVNVIDKLVVATGTEFSVELLASQAHVILYEGSVDILAERPGTAPQPVQMRSPPGTPAALQLDRSLRPGRELIARTADPVAELRLADPVHSLDWETGQLTFRNEPLSSAVERMNRYSRSPLLIGDAKAGAIRISGSFSASNPDAFVEGITGVFPVRLKNINGQRTLFSTLDNRQ